MVYLSQWANQPLRRFGAGGASKAYGICTLAAINTAYRSRCFPLNPLLLVNGPPIFELTRSSLLVNILLLAK